jgi:hypothetical protein
MGTDYRRVLTSDRPETSVRMANLQGGPVESVIGCSDAEPTITITLQRYLVRAGGVGMTVAPVECIDETLTIRRSHQ